MLTQFRPPTRTRTTGLWVSQHHESRCGDVPKPPCQQLAAVETLENVVSEPLAIE